MGGFGSGMWSRGDAKPRVESSLRLSISKLYRWGYLSGGRHEFTMTWREGGEPIASIGGSAYRDEVWLKYTTGAASGEPVEWSYKIDIEWTSCNYGGYRPWFRCPHCKDRVAVLYGRKKFLCRRCQGLAYASQTADYLNVALNKRERLEARLHNDNGLLYRPKGMHWKTFYRINAELDKHEDMVNQHFGAILHQL